MTADLKKTLFISDLHLDVDFPEIFSNFNQLVDSCNDQIDAVYILGDFFETWVGDDNRSTFNDAVITLLKSLNNKHIPVYMLHGNRDFLLGNQFFNEAKVTFLPDETKLTIYNTPVLVMHGDSLCIDDHAYQRARKLMRNRLLQFIFLRLPLSFRKKVAEKMRAASRQYTANTDSYKMDVNQTEVERIMQKYHVPFLIHGHTHKPAFHQFTVNEKPYTRIVLGAWHHKVSVLVWHENGYKELI